MGSWYQYSSLHNRNKYALTYAQIENAHVNRCIESLEWNIQVILRYQWKLNVVVSIQPTINIVPSYSWSEFSWFHSMRRRDEDSVCYFPWIFVIISRNEVMTMVMVEWLLLILSIQCLSVSIHSLHTLQLPSLIFPVTSSYFVCSKWDNTECRTSQDLVPLSNIPSLLLLWKRIEVIHGLVG